MNDTIAENTFGDRCESILLGFPIYGGKERHGRRLVSMQPGFRCIATGEYIRQRRESDEAFRMQIEQYGESLVPDNIVDPYVIGELDECCKSGCPLLYNGYPRNRVQAEFLQRCMSQRRMKKPLIMMLDINFETLANRARKDSRSERGSVYKTPAHFWQTFWNRMVEFVEVTEPAIEHFADLCEAKIHRIRIPAQDLSHDEVFAEILQIVLENTSIFPPSVLAPMQSSPFMAG